MRSMTEELYYGNISPGESMTFENIADYRYWMDKLVNAEEFLLQNLNGENKNVFQQLIDAQLQVNSMCTCNAFADGYRIGSKLMIDLLRD